MNYRHVVSSIVAQFRSDFSRSPFQRRIRKRSNYNRSLQQRIRCSLSAVDTDSLETVPERMNSSTRNRGMGKICGQTIASKLRMAASFCAKAPRCVRASSEYLLPSPFSLSSPSEPWDLQTRLRYASRAHPKSILHLHAGLGEANFSNAGGFSSSQKGNGFVHSTVCGRKPERLRETDCPAARRVPFRDARMSKAVNLLQDFGIGRTSMDTLLRSPTRTNVVAHNFSCKPDTAE